MTGGVYKIECTITGDCYIGRATSFKTRWASHRSSQRNRYFANAVSKYGLEAFVFSVLLECSPEDSVQAEIEAILAHDHAGVKLYNHMRVADTGPLRHTAETKERIRQARLGTKASEATRAKLSARQKRRIFSEEHKEKMREQINKARHVFTPEERAKNKKETAIRLKNNTYALGKHWELSDETKHRMSAAQKGNKNNLGKKYPGRTMSPESNAKRKETWRLKKLAKEAADTTTEFGQNPDKTGKSGPY